MNKRDKYLFFDTEMSGCDQIVSVGYVMTDSKGEIVSQDYYLVKPRKPIRKNTIAIHGITTEQAKKQGITLKKGLARLYNAVKDSMVVVGYAPQNDLLALAIASRILSKEMPFVRGDSIVVDVARLGTPYMIERGLIQQGQTPNLGGLYTELFNGEKYDEHNALGDAIATAKCFWELKRCGYLDLAAVIPYHKIKNLCDEKVRKKSTESEEKAESSNAEALLQLQPKAKKSRRRRKNGVNGVNGSEWGE